MVVGSVKTPNREQQELVATLELLRIEKFDSLAVSFQPPQDLTAIAKAFVAKIIYNMSTARALLHQLEAGGALR